MKKITFISTLLSVIVGSSLFFVQNTNASFEGGGVWFPNELNFVECYHGDSTLDEPVYIGVVQEGQYCEILLDIPSIEALIIHQHATGYETLSNIKYNAGIHNDAVLAHKHTDDPSSPECSYFTMPILGPGGI